MNIFKAVKSNRDLRKELRETRDALVNAKIEAGYWRERALGVEATLKVMTGIGLSKRRD